MIPENINKLAEELEIQELEAPNGVALSQTYEQLLAIYLYQNDLCNAKYLWKRIPVSVKTSTTELGKIWMVGQHMWRRDFPAMYKVLNANNWSDAVSEIMKHVQGRSCLTYEEFLTILTDCESVINSRPITLQSDSPDDLVALTPNMFLRDIQEIGVPECDVIDSAALCKRAKYRKKLREDLRQRFRIEYLDKVRSRAVDLISQAYSSITLDTVALMTGLSMEIAGAACVERGWHVEADTRIVHPVRPKSEPTGHISSEDQLHKLTDFVSFLEN